MPINQYNSLHNIAGMQSLVTWVLTALIETTRSPVPWVTMIEETGGGWVVWVRDRT